MTTEVSLLDQVLLTISEKYGIPLDELTETVNMTETEDEGSKEESIWLIPHLLKQIKENRNANLVFTGTTGSGKSWSAISLAQQIDPNFTVDRIVFTTLDFMRLVNSNLPKGSAIIYDDAGLGIPAREWQSDSAKIMGLTFQGFRYKNLISMITVPFLDFIEKQSRKLIHINFEATATQGLMKPLFPFHPIRGEDRLGFKFPVISYHGELIQINLQRFTRPSEDIIEKYEEKKLRYMEETNRKHEEELRLKAEMKEAQMKIDALKLKELKTKLERRTQLKQQVADLRAQKFTIQEISTKLNISASTVHSLIES